jgi:hypothetical protein
VNDVTERRVALGALAAATIDVVALHVLEPTFDPRSRFMSEYALSSHGSMMRAAFVSAAIAGVALARIAARRDRRIAAVGLAGWSLGMTLAAIFVTDATLAGSPRTWVGVAHDAGADLAFVAITIAAFAHGGLERAVAAVLVLEVIGGRILAAPGLGQRVFAATAIAWQAWVATRAR